MENNKNNNNGGKQASKTHKKLPKDKVFGTNSAHFSEETCSTFMGGIVEKDFSSPSFTTPFHLPSPLPFPVARHRSHGPHWTPASQLVAGGGGVDGVGNDDDGEEENDLENYGPLAKFAKPIEKKKKKGLDLSKWKEALGDDTGSHIQKNKKKTARKAEERQMIHEHADRNTDKNSFDNGISMDIDNNNNSHLDLRDSQSVESPYNDVDMGFEELSSTNMVLTREKIVRSSFGHSSLGDDQGHMSLESQIDAENRARLERMSPEEIAEAQADIRNRINPELLNRLKKRGIKKLEKRATSGLSTGDVDVLGDKQSDRIVGENKSSAQESTSLPETQTNQLLQSKPDEEAQNSISKGSSMWSNWSKRVEAVRNMRFSLDGNVIEGNSSGSTYTADNVAKRDFLRTEGDPGAAGYTIKEALALARSVVTAQRALALHLLASVLNNALHNICRSEPDCLVDWQAVWAYALGPEPELALSIRLAIDDNHQSVVLASARVIQCILACDLNEDFFDITTKMTRLDLFTAPVFRSRPDAKHGYFGGGFWKYSSKPSNIIPRDEEVMDDKNEGGRTLKDDNAVASQDVAAGLVRMEILPRLLYLLEAGPAAPLEQCILSILIAVARHSTTCANAVWNCERLVQTIVDRFNMQDTLEHQGAKIKSVTLLRVLAQSSKTICVDIISKGFFQVMTWQLYRVTHSIEEWVRLGSEKCRLSSELMVEQLSFWKVCIMYGYCVSTFTGFFPALCLWLNPPTPDILIEKKVFNEFASVTTEIYLVLEALADRLPDPYSSAIRNQQFLDSCGDDAGTWCWIDVGPMVDSALQWLQLTGGTTLMKSFDEVIGVDSKCADKKAGASSLFWVLSALMHFLQTVLIKATPNDSFELKGGTNDKLMPEFVLKLSLQIIKNGIFSFSDENEDGRSPNPCGMNSFINKLCYFRHKADPETSLASVWCLNTLFHLVVSTDRLIHQTRDKIGYKSFEGRDSIFKSSLPQWRLVLSEFMSVVTSEWHRMCQIEVFGRGGPAPGVGVGWGALRGGFWSPNAVASQASARLLIELLESWISSFPLDLPDQEETFMVQIINSLLASSLMIGPGDKMILQKIFDILLQVPILEYLDQRILCFLRSYHGKESLEHEEEEADLVQFSSILTSHFADRWLDVKKKKKPETKDGDSFTSKRVNWGGSALATISEDVETSDVVTREDRNSVMVEWARQRMPLPSYWLLSPITTVSNTSSKDLSNSSTGAPPPQDPSEFLEVAKAGLFFLLGIEAMSSSLSDEDNSPVQCIPLIWRLHSLSVPLLVGMGLLEEEKSRDMYEALQSLYGRYLDGLQLSSAKASDISGVKRKCLMFQTEIHENYSTFIEALVEQFAAVSYGDLVYGRQIAIYLHGQVETSVRLATWNALSNARVLELLPPLDKCISRAEGYLEPVEDDDGILEAYMKSWVSGSLDRSALRGSMSYMVALHHLSSFIFSSFDKERSLLRNKLVKTLLRDYSRQKQHEAMMLDLIHYNHSDTNLKTVDSLESDIISPRLELLKEACEGNSQLLTEVDKLKFSIANKRSIT
ncbi:hypothetical protein vseg_007035 [Gypsophila vaccaria]